MEKFKARGQYEKQLSSEKKSEFVARVRKIINADQLTELAGVVDVLSSEAANDGMVKYYILVDRLDERWVDVSIRFKLIRALIESLRTFRKIRNLKILVSLRSDILERVVQETGDLTFQREKFEESFIRLRWDRNSLRDLVQRRIKLMFRRQYTNDDILFEDIFTSKVGNQDPFDYLIERTLMRPRDLISFINECIKASEGKYEVSPQTIRNAEKEFSRIRKQALEYEWLSTFPTLPALFKLITDAKKVSSTVSELSTSSLVDELILSIASGTKYDYDPVFICANKCVNEKGTDSSDFVKEALSTLYRIGAIGLKLRPDERFTYSHTDFPVIATDLIAENVRVRVHPMLWRSLNLIEHNIENSDGRR